MQQEIIDKVNELIASGEKQSAAIIQVFNQMTIDDIEALYIERNASNRMMKMVQRVKDGQSKLEDMWSYVTCVISNMMVGR